MKTDIPVNEMDAEKNVQTPSKNNKKKGNSFTLVEVLVFVSILSVFFVIALTVTIMSMRNMTVSQHRIIATRYAEELKEWIRAEKEDDWNSFVVTASLAGTKYCFNTTLDATVFLSGSTPVADCPTSDFGTPAIYKRVVTLTAVPPAPYQIVNANIKVSWTDMGRSYSVDIATQYSPWEL